MDVGLVCDSCSTFNPIGVPQCSRCGAALSLDKLPPGQSSNQSPGPSPSQPPGQPPAPSSSQPARQPPASEARRGYVDDTMARVRHDIPDDEPGTGTLIRGTPERAASTPPAPPVEHTIRSTSDKPRSPRRTQLFGAMQEAHAKLVLIKGGGQAGVSFTLAGDEHLIGRHDTAIVFEDDPFLSPLHANFLYRFGALMVRDEGSTNGVYIRIQGEVPIHFGDRFLVGEQVLEVQATPDTGAPEPIDDGTYFFASPRRPSHFRVVQRLLGGETGLAYRALAPRAGIGREGNDIDFPDDPFISGRHAQLSLKNNRLTLTDLDSKNGTFLRINGEHPLKHGDYVFMGQQLLRVEIV